ncbi:MAG: lytic transglycosylase domain-containing protein [Chitinispirillaceae bacterium]|nr:lytic transglycosylase domain-containing protein [Chitinispirillaceae bacterium]
MAIQPASRKKVHVGFFFRHGALWLSELLANAFVALMLVCFMSLTAVTLLNSLTIRHLDASIASLESEKIHNSYAIDALKEQARILAVMRKLAGQRVADRTLCDVAALVYRSSRQFGYDPLLLVAVIRVEGVFNPNALGRFRSGKESGALGLMQLKFETAQEVARQLEMPKLERDDLFNPGINLVLGVAYLTQLVKQFRSFKLGLLAYNLGPGTVRQTLTNREPLPIAYYRKVLRSYYRLKKIAREIE